MSTEVGSGYITKQSKFLRPYFTEEWYIISFCVVTEHCRLLCNYGNVR